MIINGRRILTKVKSELAASGVQYLQGDHQLIISAHAFIIILYMVIPGLVGEFGNYLLLVQIGTPACFKNSIQWLSFYSAVRRSNIKSSTSNKNKLFFSFLNIGSIYKI